MILGCKSVQKNATEPTICFCPSEAATAICASRASLGKFSSDRDLATCGTLQILIGKKDQFNYDPEGSFLKEIKARNGNVQWTEYEGAHEVQEQSLLDALNR